MNSVQYGSRTIDYLVVVDNELTSHYISVEKGVGVVLKGNLLSDSQADALILKKAAWIIDKLDLLSFVDEGDIQTGSRWTYLGRSYYVNVVVDESLKKVIVDFTYSKFNVSLPSRLNTQSEIMSAFEYYMKLKAVAKLTPRVEKLASSLGFEYNSLVFKKLIKSWGSCSASNNIMINVDAVKLPWPLIDYLIVHELVHTRIKNHSKEFWAELSKYIPNWKELDERMGDLKI